MFSSVCAVVHLEQKKNIERKVEKWLDPLEPK